MKLARGLSAYASFVLLLALLLKYTIMPVEAAGCPSSFVTTPSQNLISPKGARVSFWSPTDAVEIPLKLTYRSKIPMDLMLLLDTTTLNTSSALDLFNSIKMSQLSAILGSDLDLSMSRVGLDLYAEDSSLFPSRLVASQGFLKTSNAASSIISSFSAAILVSTETKSAISSPVALLNKTSELISAWRTSWSPSAFRAVIVITPNSFSQDQDQWQSLIDVAKSTSVVPIFFNPLQQPNSAWVDAISTAWIAAFPSSPIPACTGSQVTWKSLDLTCAVSLAKSIATSATFQPVSLSPLISVGSVVGDSSTRNSSFVVSWDPIRLPINGSITLKVGFLGWAPVSIESTLMQVPWSTSTNFTFQSKGKTSFVIPVVSSSANIQIKIESLPASGILAHSNIPAQVGQLYPSNTFEYTPSVSHPTIESFNYTISDGCGIYGPYRATLDLSLVPTNLTTSAGSLTLNEDETSSQTINLAALVTTANPNSKIILLTLPWTLGNLTLGPSGPEAQIGVRYDLTTASIFAFKLLGPSRGPGSTSIEWLVEDGVGSTKNDTFEITVTDIDHSPTIQSISTSGVGGIVYMLVNDIDGDQISCTITISGTGGQACWYAGDVSTCQSGSITRSNGPSSYTISVSTPIISISTVTVTVVANGKTDTKSFSPPLISLVPLGNFLVGVTQTLLSRTGLITLPSPPAGTSNCWFPLSAQSGILSFADGTGLISDGHNFSWSSGKNNLTYSPFPGMSGSDHVYFQCLYDSSRQVTAIYSVELQIPASPPRVAPLSLNLEPSIASSILIPVKGLVNAIGDLKINNLSASVGNIVVKAADVIEFVPNLLGSSLITFDLCFVDNPLLCSGIVSYYVNILNSLPLIGPPSQIFYAVGGGFNNSWTIQAGSGASKFRVTSIAATSLGWFFVGDIPITPGTTYSSLNFQYQYTGYVPLLSDIIPLASFTYVLVDESGLSSQPGEVIIYPDSTFLEQQLELITNILPETLSLPLDIASIFPVQIDVFGDYPDIPSSSKRSSSQTLSVARIATIDHMPDPLRNGRLMYCDSDMSCTQITKQTNVTDEYTVWFVPPLRLPEINLNIVVSWVLRLANNLGQSITGIASLTVGGLAPTVTQNLALVQSVAPVSKLLSVSNLLPTDCQALLSGATCVNGEQVLIGSLNVAQGSVVVFKTPRTQIIGDFTMEQGSTMILELFGSGSASGVPFVNVTGNVSIDGEIIVVGDYNQFESIAQSQEPRRFVQGSEISQNSTKVGLKLSGNKKRCTSHSANIEEASDNDRVGLAVVFNMKSDRKCQQIQIVWITCAAVGGVILLLVVGLFLLFRYNPRAKRWARPFSVRKKRGLAYRTQPTPHSQGSSVTSHELYEYSQSDS